MAAPCKPDGRWKKQGRLNDKVANLQAAAAKYKKDMDDAEAALGQIPGKISSAESSMTEASGKAAIKAAAKELASLKSMQVKLAKKVAARIDTASKLAESWRGEADRWKALRDDVGEIDPCCLAKRAKANADAAEQKANTALAAAQSASATKKVKLNSEWQALDSAATAARNIQEQADLRVARYRQRMHDIVSNRTYPKCPESEKFTPAPPAVLPVLGNSIQPCPYATSYKVSEVKLNAYLQNIPASKRNKIPLPPAQLADQINKAAADAGIKDQKGMAAFMAQMTVETDHFTASLEGGSACIDDSTYFEAVYGGREDLGNLCGGDGAKYRGRGPLQLTGRANYLAYAKATGTDVVNNPDQVASDPNVGWNTASWYWKSHGANAPVSGLPDTLDTDLVPLSNKPSDLANDSAYDSFNQITRKINGGFNDGTGRREFYNAAMIALK